MIQMDESRSAARRRRSARDRRPRAPRAARRAPRQARLVHPPRRRRCAAGQAPGARRRLPHRGRRQLPVAPRTHAARRRADGAASRAVPCRPRAPVPPGDARGGGAPGRSAEAPALLDAARRHRSTGDRRGDLPDLRSDPRGRGAAPAHEGLAVPRGTRRRAVIRRLLVRTALLLASVTLAACAAAGTVATSFDATPRRSVPSLDTRAHAYHEFVVAQMAAQAGRFTQAIPALPEALKRAPNSAYLWTTLAQWLLRPHPGHAALSPPPRALPLPP